MNFKYHPFLHRLSQLLVIATFALIFIGGMVTSKGAGLAVPDWPLSYGTLNPPGWWHIENVRLEHGHRLFASFVGLITTILAIGLWITEKRRWVRWLGVGAFFGVLAQGILGGLRVNLISTELAMVHACLAQAFFCLTLFLAMVTGPNFTLTPTKDEMFRGSAEVSAPRPALSHQGRGGEIISSSPASYGDISISDDAQRSSPLGVLKYQFQQGEDQGEGGLLKVFTLILFIAVYLQIVLGAVMRHMGAGLAIPDFPLAFGGLLPSHWDAGILVHFLHRAGAILVTVVIFTVSFFIFTKRSASKPLVTPAIFLLAIVGFQIFLGAQVIWLGRPPVVTTLHVLSGALILGTSFALMVRSRLL